MSDPINFGLIGLAGTVEFQKCLTYIEMLNHKKPEEFPEPQIRPMLEYDWQEYLTSARRKFGKHFWTLKKPLVVFVDGEYLGDDDDLMNFLGERMQIKISRDYDCMAKDAVREIFKKYREIGRRFVYFSISINGHPAGTMIFMLYADLVPKTSKRFIRKCKSKQNGYTGKIIHRIMDRSWIQFGGYDMMSESVCCENYKVPHNRRGVLSMCNNNRHLDNTTQFFVCLNPTPWMDYRYVAFGQLIQGEKVLHAMEILETEYQNPYDIIKITKSGELNIYNTLPEKSIDLVDNYLEARKFTLKENVGDVRCIPSEMKQSHYKRGYYSYVADIGGQLPLDNYPMSYSGSSLSSSTVFLGEDIGCEEYLSNSFAETFVDECDIMPTSVYQDIWPEAFINDEFIKTLEMQMEFCGE